MKKQQMHQKVNLSAGKEQETARKIHRKSNCGTARSPLTSKAPDILYKSHTPLCMKSDLGRSLVKSRFKSRERVNKGSLIECSSLSSIKIGRLGGNTEDLVGSGLSMRSKSVHKEIGKNVSQKENVDSFCGKSGADFSLNFSLCVPPRVPFNRIPRNHYQFYEQRVFNYWASRQKPIPYERNIETWRQFWLTCEKSDVLAQVLDARNPAFFFIEDIIKMYPEKKHILLINKCDLVLGDSKTSSVLVETSRRECKSMNLEVYKSLCLRSERKNKLNVESVEFLHKYDHFFYSSTEKDTTLFSYLQKFRGYKLGLIGYPNVGKSSTINMILQSKKVKTSLTPGKTKHLQNIIFGNIELIDCPGLVFPKYGKFELVINGVLNVDKTIDYDKFFTRLILFIGEERLKNKYLSRNSSLEENFNKAGLDRGFLFKKIVKDYVAGKI